MMWKISMIIQIVWNSWNWKTFEENARLKAETISHSGKMVLADDLIPKMCPCGARCLVSLFAGVGATDRENNAKLLHELAMVFELKDRSAQFHTTLVVASPNKKACCWSWLARLILTFEPTWKWLWYDPLFPCGETVLAQLTPLKK